MCSLSCPSLRRLKLQWMAAFVKLVSPFWTLTMLQTNQFLLRLWNSSPRSWVVGGYDDFAECILLSPTSWDESGELLVSLRAALGTSIVPNVLSHLFNKRFCTICTRVHLYFSKQFCECEDTQTPLSDSKVCFTSTFYLKLVAVIEFIALLSSTGAGCYTWSQADKPPQYHKAQEVSTK